MVHAAADPAAAAATAAACLRALHTWLRLLRQQYKCAFMQQAPWQPLLLHVAVRRNKVYCPAAHVAVFPPVLLLLLCGPARAVCCLLQMLGVHTVSTAAAAAGCSCLIGCHANRPPGMEWSRLLCTLLGELAAAAAIGCTGKQLYAQSVCWLYRVNDDARCCCFQTRPESKLNASLAAHLL